MTWDEFHDQWLSQHIAKFPGIVSWLKKFPVTSQDPLLPTRRKILETWHQTLSSVELGAAIEATAQIGSDEHPEPNGYGNHPLTVASMCRGTKRARHEYTPPLTRVRDGHAEYSCTVCRDTGDIAVWHPRTMQAARDGKLRDCAARGELYKVSVACGNCSAFSPARYHDPVFDAKRMLPTPLVLNTNEGLDALEEFVAARDVERTTWTPDSWGGGF